MATGNVSLLDAAKNMPPSRERGIIMTYALTTHVFTSAPIETQMTGVKKWKLAADLAYSSSANAYRNIGSDFTATKTPTQPFVANVKVAGGRVQLDRVLKKLSPGDISVQRQGQISAQARQLTIDVFEGLGGSAIWGIDSWITNEEVFKNQTMNMGTASAGGLITEDGLDELVSLVNVIPGNTFIYANDAPSRRIRKLSRGTGTFASGTYVHNVNYSPEQFGQFAGAYDDIPIVTMKDGKGTDMLSNTEGDGSSTTVYIVTYGPENYTLFQQSPMEIIDMKEISVLEAFDVEWLVNGVPQSIRSIARMRFVKNAVV